MEINTYCRICEPMCGLVATVEDGRLVGVQGDRDHVSSAGFHCRKAQAMVEVTHDPDRVRVPLRRVGGPGEFEPVSWDEATADIGRRLREIQARHGDASFATVIGNPPAAGYATALWYSGFIQALGVRYTYGINAEDASARMAANALLYGSVALLPKPDLWHTDFALIIGANTYVSHGSLISEPRVRDALDEVVTRGGRVVVVDPRRSETARRYEHVAVHAGGDPWLLFGLIHVLVEENLVDHEFVARHTTGYEELAQAARAYAPEAVGDRCGVPPDVIRQLARDFAAAPSALVYGRTGTCRQRFGTLTNALQDTVMILTGNVERRGGLLFGWSPIDFVEFAERSGFASFGKTRTRVHGHPDVFGMLPSTSLVPDIAEPGPGQVKALMSLGSNVVLTSAGGGAPLERALESLDLHFSLDLYVNETNRYADYVLPVTTFYERDDFPMATMGMLLRPAIWATEAVVAPPDGVRPEWQILDAIARQAGRGSAAPHPVLRLAARAGLRVRPRHLADILIRTSPIGDWFGVKRSGVSFAKLIRHHPHGRALRDQMPAGQLAEALRTADQRIPLASPALVAEFERLRTHADERPAEFPLRLLSLRERNSHNSWMHNTERMMPAGRTQSAHVHPDDLASAGVVDRQVASVVSPYGRITLPVVAAPDMTPGNVAIPHGWGHAAGWRRANAAGGANVNELVSALPEDIEPVAGMSILSGVPIRIEPGGSETETVGRIEA